jgi:hypothetical protein
MTLLCKKIVVNDEFGRIFQGRLWLKKGCFAADDDDSSRDDDG